MKEKRILVVEDNPSLLMGIQGVLEVEGYIVSTATNGKEALEELAVARPDLIVADIMMPVMDGYETTKRIRAQQEFSSLPILALTAKAMKGDREKCLQAGANDYLSKPIDVDRLFSMLRVWLYQ